MLDDNQQTEQNRMYSLIQSITRGLQELPTDSLTRVRNFLVEYLGQPDQPVPFGGREHAFTNLHVWLADPQSSPYLLLAAPAGRGKSALLLRWCQQLQQQPQIALAYFPVSIRFRTNLASVAFPALTALLAHLHSEPLPKDPHLSTEVWRGLFTSYLTRPLPDGRRLLLVLDGIDEAADWTADHTLFPLDPPAGLRIVVAARSLANDPGPEAWLERLGWTQQELAQTLTLPPLDRPGIASVLVQMGFPLELLSSRIDIVAELYRLSEGDPLLVRLYVDDLWQQGTAAITLQASDLRTISPGLNGYFERWWREQRQLWNDDVQPRTATTQLMLSLLASAFGPLNKEDLHQLAPAEDGFQTLAEVEQTMAPLARFVIGDGSQQGYVFSHPRLSNYCYEEQLDSQQRQAVKQRFLTWGQRTLTALNTGSLAAEQAAPYIVQFYGVHLERAQASTQTRLALVSDGWRQAWEKLDQGLAGYLSDVERAWRAAERADKQSIAEIREEHKTTQQTISGDKTGEAAAIAPYFGAEIRSLLNQASINSIAGNISPHLMFEAVKAGIWTATQGLATLRLLPDLAPRARALVALAPLVDEPLRTAILHEAVDTASMLKDQHARLDTLLSLAPGLSEELLWQLLSAISAIEDEADQAGALAELAPSLAAYPTLLDTAIDNALKITEDEFRALALAGLAPFLTAYQQLYVLQLIQGIEDERDQAQVLMALAPFLPADIIVAILPVVNALQDNLARIRLLAELLQHLPEHARGETLAKLLTHVQELEDRDYRVEILVKLAPFLSETGLQQALQEIQWHWDERTRAAALQTIAPHVPATLRSQLLHIAMALKNEEERTEVLIQILPDLTNEDLALVLANATNTRDEGQRARLLAQLAALIPQTLVAELMEVMTSIADPGYLAWLLAETEEPLRIKLYAAEFSMNDVFKHMRHGEERVQTLLAIIPMLSDDALYKLYDFLLPDIFGVSWQLWNETQQTHILTKLSARLPEKWVQTALMLIEQLANELHKTQALLAIAPAIHEARFSQALAIVRNIKERGQRAQVLEAFVTATTAARRGPRIQEMIQTLQLIKDEAERTQCIISTLPYLAQPIAPDHLQTLFITSTQLQPSQNRLHLLRALAPYLTTTMIDTILTLLWEETNEEDIASLLTLLAPYLSEEQASSTLEMLKELQKKHLRIQILVALAPYLSAQALTTQIQSALSLNNEDRQVEILNILIPYAPEAILSDIWQTVVNIQHEGRRTLLLAPLALRLPDESFPQLWEAIAKLEDTPGQVWIVKQLAPQASEQRFLQLWQVTQKLKDNVKRRSFTNILIEAIPANLFTTLWREQYQNYTHTSLFYTQQAGEAVIPVMILMQLARKVTPEVFPQFWHEVQHIQSEQQCVLIINMLAPRIPPSYLPEVLNLLDSISKQGGREMLLLALLTHHPQATLATVWQMRQQLEQRPLWEQMLKQMLPYLTREQLSIISNDICEPTYRVQQHVETISTLLPYLTQEQSWLLFEKVQSIQTANQPRAGDQRWCLHATAALLPYLPQSQQEGVIAQLQAAVVELKAEEEQAWLLIQLAQNAKALSDEQLEFVSKHIWTLKTSHYRTQVLQALATTVAPERWQQALALAKTQVQTSGNPSIAIEMLQTLHERLQQISIEQLYPVLNEILHQLARQSRHEALHELTNLLPAIQRVGGVQAIQQAGATILDVGSWWP
jgi:hypothetical protein